MSESKTRGTLSDYKKSDWYDAETADTLQRQLNALSVDDSTLRAQAEAEYRPSYENQKNALRDTLERETAAALSERDALSSTYEKRRRLANESYDQSAATLNNRLNARGLGRSSLTATNNAYLERERGRTLSDIGAEESSAVDAINERIAQLAQNAARDERTLDTSYSDKLNSRINELKSANQSAAISLQLQIAALQQQGYEAYQKYLNEQAAQSLNERELAIKERAQQLDEDEFTQKYGLNDAASTSSGRKKSTSTGTNAVKSAEQSTGNTASLLGTLGSSLKKLLTSQSSKAGTTKKSGSASTKSSYKPTIQRRSFE